ncbi:putative nuclease HARBI1 [Hydra vulgaris]|uniref:Nuclease HARBI1 n=1 Tax=Hydra vulgaris TaxID=6087 RepID=A0ABM4C9T8_HYDVU
MSNHISRIIIDRANPLEVYNGIELKMRYRFSKETFLILANDIINSNINNRECPFSSVQQLAIAFRFYATGSFQRVIGDMEELKVNQSTVCRLPREADSLIIQQRFYQIQRFPGCKGAIDGTHIPIINPGGENPEIYRNRKGFFSLNCQPGSVHNLRVFANLAIKEVLEARQHVHVMGDSGYLCKQYLMTPFSNPKNESEIQYNYSLRITRMAVECCFGILKKRFPCLNIPLQTKLQNSIAIIISCFVLHNIALLENDHWEDHEIQNSNEEDGAEAFTNIFGEAKRNQIVDQF